MTTQQPTVAPYGSWRSPIDIDATLSAGVDLAQLVADDDRFYWLESVPADDGRMTIMASNGGEAVEITPAPTNVRSRVQEYGGGAFHARQGHVAWVDDSQAGTVVLRKPTGETVALTTGDRACTYGDLRVHPDLEIVLAVREDHRGEGEAITTIVSLPFGGGADTVLCEGADFYANPELNDDLQLAWFEWQHPSMPWDATTLKVGQFADMAVTDIRVITGGPDAGISAQHPRWCDAGLLFMSDASGYWNLHLWDGETTRAVHDDPFDFDSGVWVLGNAAYGVLGDVVLCSFFENGVQFLATVKIDDGELTRLNSVAYATSIAARNGRAAAIVSWPAEAPAVVGLDAEGTTDIIRQVVASPDADYTSVARSLTFEGDAGTVQAWYYPPTNVDYTPPQGERPPLIVKTHGGPTSFAANSWNPTVQFWTSRGFAMLDVNYSGSTGFGRAYRERLKGQWGVIDVSDVINAVEAAVDAGLADPGRVSITGGSAGGYTTLQSLVVSDVFAAGVSSYGIGDLKLLISDTHKFEARYPEGLIGPWPEAEAVYAERSPINHVDQLSAPMLILQGLDDKVVPPNQAEAMADAVRTQGLPVALLMFEGEGHGFRKSATRRAALEAQLSFYAQLFGFTPADDVPTLQIENQPGQ